MLSRLRLGALLCGATLLYAPAAFAHVSITGPGYADQTQVLTFSVGHGCEGADTYKIEVSIPKEVTTLRAMPSVSFGDPEITTDDAGIVTGVSWTKSGKVRAKDDGYYQLGLRIKVPNAPFTTLYFPTKQTCRAADGTESVTDWKATIEEVAAAKEGEEPEPAPTLTILPVRYPGWNKLKAAKDIKDLSVFNDAQIVWSGDSAYSKNPTTAELIAKEDGVEPLTEIKANAEIWVKY